MSLEFSFLPTKIHLLSSLSLSAIVLQVLAATKNNHIVSKGQPGGCNLGSITTSCSFSTLYILHL